MGRQARLLIFLKEFTRLTGFKKHHRMLMKWCGNILNLNVMTVFNIPFSHQALSIYSWVFYPVNLVNSV